MRFLIEYKDFKTKEEKNVSLGLLDTFLNQHFIGDFHGSTFECILIRFINNPSPTKKYRKRVLYQTIAEIEVAASFSSNDKVNFEDFRTGLFKVKDAILKVKDIEVKGNLDFYEEDILKGLKKSLREAPASLEELVKFANMQNENIKANNAKRVDNQIEQFRLNTRPLTKKITFVTVTSPFEETAPNYSFVYSEIFSNLFRKTDIMTPGYSEIVISLGDTMELAKQELSLEDRVTYTYATIDTKKYLESDKQTRSRMMFKSVCEGLKLIAEFDHLEKEKIDRVIKEVGNKGIDLELIYFSKQNARYLAEVIYKVPKVQNDKALFKLKVTDLNTQVSKITKIDYIDLYWAPYSFGKMLIKKDEIIIKGRESFRAQISRKADKLPEEYTFNMGDLFK